MRCLWIMFVTAVCFLFLLKLKWPKNKNIYDVPIYSTKNVVGVLNIMEAFIFQKLTAKLCALIVGLNKVIIHCFLDTKIATEKDTNTK